MDAEESPIRVGLVEDQPLDRESITALLTASADFDCVAVCTSAAEARARLPDSRAEIVLMDIHLPDQSGIDCVRDLKALMTSTQFMMLTVVLDDEAIFKALAAGATGYLLKSATPEQILLAIRELRDHGAPMTTQVARLVVESFQQRGARSPELDRLTQVETRVLDLLSRGHLYKEIAEHLQIRLGTVRTHVWHIYQKLHVSNRTEAAVKFLAGRPRS